MEKRIPDMPPQDPYHMDGEAIGQQEKRKKQRVADNVFEAALEIAGAALEWVVESVLDGIG